MSEIIIEACQLCCKSGRRYLLENVNWTIRRGEHWLVFGANGSGKTTLLSIVAGYKPPISGTLTVFGQRYSNDNVLALCRRIGWVSSSFFDKYFFRETALNIVLSGLSGGFGLSFGLTDSEVRRAKALLGELRLGGQDQPAL